MSEGKKIPLDVWYDANFDPQLLEMRQEAEEWTWKFAQANPRDTQMVQECLDHLFELQGEGITILSPVYVDYCHYTSIGEGTFINHGAYFMDGGTIEIGSHCFIGPFCHFYTALHPLQVQPRNEGLEKALPIRIEDNVWLGGDVSILPGVTIGEGSVIGAGSVVTRSIPAGVVAMGVPCRVVRKMESKEE